jgi:hypothetical protein
MQETDEERAANVEMYRRIAAKDGQMLTKVVGDSHVNDDGSSRQEIITRCKPGDALTLKSEPHNQYDPNAVAVLTRNGEQIGYLSRDRALFLKPYLDSAGGALPAVIREITGGTKEKPDLGVNISAELPNPDPKVARKRPAPPVATAHGASTWLAVGLSILAVAFSGLQWLEAHQQKSLSETPSVDFYIQDDDSNPHVGLAVTNSGPGIARIKSITFYVDRVPVEDSTEALRRGKFHENFDHGVQIDPGDSLAVGETIYLIDYKPKDKKELSKFIDFLDDHLAVNVNYCSIDGACRGRCSTKGRC